MRELENRAGLYLQEIEAVESLCRSPHQSALTTRDLVDIIRKIDDEFMGLAANLYMVHERVKVAKAEYLRRSKSANNHQNPFLAIEGRFGETFQSISGQRQQNAPRSSAQKTSDTVGGSPFDSSCYMNHAPSVAVPQASSPFQKPNFFGNPSNSSTGSALFPALTTTAATPLLFGNTVQTSLFGVNKPTST